MSNKPDREWREKGLSIAVWGDGESASYQLQKSFKRKGSEEWERQSIRLFHNELENLGGLVMKALSGSYAKSEMAERLDEREARHAAAKGNAYVTESPGVARLQTVDPASFSDDDIPF